MVTTMEDSLAISILVASVEVSQLLPVTAVIKTLDEKDRCWADVSNSLIE